MVENKKQSTSRKPNEWIEFLKKLRPKFPKLTYKELIIKAKPLYAIRKKKHK